MSNTRGPLGTSLHGIGQFSTQNPFLNFFKTAIPWLAQKPTEWDTGATIDLDANGWVRTLPQGANAPFDYATTVILPNGRTAQPGRYVVYYEGQGKVSYSLSATKINSTSQPGRDVLQVSRDINDPLSGPMTLTIEQTNPNNYIRNIKVYRERDLPLVEMGLRFGTDFLRNLKNYDTFRYLEWQDIIGSTESSWSERATLDDATFMRNGAPLELIIALANQTGTKPWIHIPQAADDNYVREMAQYVRQNLNPNLEFYLEYGNEGWNLTEGYTGDYAFKQAAIRWDGYWQRLQNRPENQGKSLEDIQLENASWIQYTGVRTSEISQIWDQVFGSSASRMTMTYSVLSVAPGFAPPGLNAAAWLDEQARQGIPPAQRKRPKDFMDALAVAFYMGRDMGNAANAGITKSWLSLPDGGFARAFEFLSKGGYTDESGQFILPWVSEGETINTIRPRLAQQVQLAKNNGLRIVAYEGGQSLLTSFGPLYGDPELDAFFQEMNRRPEMQTLYEEYFDMWNEVTDGADFMHFYDVGQYNLFGSWGALEDSLATNSPKYQAITNYSNSQNQIGLFRRGTPNNDVLTGSSKSDTLLGANGDDSINGANGNDYLHGGNGDDTIFGGANNDVLAGSVGNDSLTGGVGGDAFHYAKPGDGGDIITDFKSADGDRILLLSNEFAGLSGLQGTTGRLVASQYGEGSTRALAIQQAIAANGGLTGAAVLGVTAGGTVQIFYDPNTGVANNEVRVATLRNQSLTNIGLNQIHLYELV